MRHANGVWSQLVRFVEPPVFTEVVVGLLTDDEYAALQAALLTRPDLGVVIPGAGSIRKARRHLPGRGKRGGLRVIYLWQAAPGVLRYALVLFTAVA